MAPYVEIPETDLDANSGFVESVAVQITRNLVSHETRITDLENFLGAESWTVKTADYTLTSDDMDGTNAFTTDGASGAVIFTLPAALSGMKVTIANAENQSVSIVSDGTEEIYGDNISGATQITTTDQGDIIVLFAHKDGEWVIHYTGTFIGAGRAIVAGGTTGSDSDVIDYFEISTLGNATDFGNLTDARRGTSTLSSLTRAVTCGGQDAVVNTMDFVTIASPGNATDFGDMTGGRYDTSAGGSSTRGIVAGGNSGGGNQNVIEYITIASTGNGTDFGDLLEAKSAVNNVCNGTRLVSAGGETSIAKNVMEYVTVASTGNATDFGDLTVARKHLGRADNATTGVFSGGGTGASATTNVSDYITIASTGNAIDFGDLTVARTCAGTSSPTRGISVGGSTTNDANNLQNVIDYFSISAIENSTDFGDLTASRTRLGATSSSHGGLNG